MNKAELIETVAAEMNEPKAHAARWVDAVLNALSTGVREDEKVNIANFGTFKLRHRKERPGINPTTRKPIVIPASNTMGFTPAKSLRETLNGARSNGHAG